MNRRLLILTSMVLLALVGVLGSLGAAGTQEEAGTDAEGPVRIRIMKYGWENFGPLLPYMTDSIRDRFGLEVEWITPARDTYAEQVNIIFASGDYPEIMDINRYSVVAEAAENGVLLPLDDVVESHPIWRAVDQQEFSATSVNGTIYGFLLQQTAPNVMVYRKDWADRLGLATPVGPDALFEMLRAFTEDDPDGNGEDDTYGLTSRNGLFGDGPTVSEPLWRYFLPDSPQEVYVTADGTLRPVWYHTDELIEAIRWVNRAYDEGLIDPEFIVDGKSSHENKFINGFTGVWQKQNIWVPSRYENMVQLDPEAELAVVPAVENGFGRLTYIATPNSNTTYITDRAVPHEERIKEFYAWFLSSEGALFQQVGPEGVTYTFEDGEFTWLSDEFEEIPYQPASLPFSFPPVENPVGLHPLAAQLIEQTEFQSVANADVLLERSERWRAIASDIDKTITEVLTEAILGAISPEEAIERIERMNDRLNVDEAIAEVNALR